MARSISTEPAAAPAWRSWRLLRFGALQHLAANPPLLVVTAMWPRLVFRALLWVLIGAAVNGAPGAAFTFVGAVAITLLQNAVTGMSDVTVTEKVAGTFTMLLRSTTPVVWVFATRGAAYTVAAAADTVVVAVVAGAVTGHLDVVASMLPVAPVFGLMALSASAAGLACAAVAVGKRAEVAIYNGFVTLVDITCGALVPRPALGPLAPVGHVLPLTHGLTAVRDHLGGEPIAADVALEAAVGAGWLAVAVVLFTAQASRARRTGSDAFS